MGNSEHTERVRRLWQRAAPSYDRQMRVVEKLQFGGGQAWVCSATNSLRLTIVSAAECWNGRNTQGQQNFGDGKCLTFCFPEITPKLRRGEKSKD